MAGAFVVGVEGARLPVALRRRRDGGVEGGEVGSGFEAEFGDEPGGVVFVVLVWGHGPVPDCCLVSYRSSKVEKSEA